VAVPDIGPYRLLGRLGEGTFGTVYLAEQTSRVRRQVAIKILKASADSPSIKARFRVEAQSLALMNHPNIARVLDAGSTPDGRSYFVMEHVAGEPLTRYCDNARLDLRQRLGLFIDICRAVQHAHQRGVIHRDLKPGNILVALVDDKPIVKIIDFGVAKAAVEAAGPDGETAAEYMTYAGQPMGTFEYMAPEQAGNAHEVDVRADVFALGVILYELLSGELPLDRAVLAKADLADKLRMVKTQQAVSAATRIGSGAAAHTFASARNIDLGALKKQLAAELEWIPLKAMENEPARRYDSASQLASDVQAYLENRPLIAGPPSQIYKARKFVRRHTLSVGLAAAAVLLLVAGLAVSIALYKDADESRIIAQAAEGRQRAANTALQRQLYVTSIMAADASARAGHYADAREQLRKTDPNLRGWEWRSLYNTVDSSVASGKAAEGYRIVATAVATPVAPGKARPAQLWAGAVDIQFWPADASAPKRTFPLPAGQSVLTACIDQSARRAAVSLASADPTAADSQIIILDLAGNAASPIATLPQSGWFVGRIEFVGSELLVDRYLKTSQDTRSQTGNTTRLYTGQVAVYRLDGLQPGLTAGTLAAPAVLVDKQPAVSLSAGARAWLCAPQEGRLARGIVLSDELLGSARTIAPGRPVADEEIIELVGAPRDLKHIDVSADRQTLYFATGTNLYRAVLTRDERDARRFTFDKPGCEIPTFCNALSLSPNGSLLAVSFDRGGLRILKTPGLETVADLRGSNAALFTLRWADDSTLIAVSQDSWHTWQAPWNPGSETTLAHPQSADDWCEMGATLVVGPDATYVNSLSKLLSVPRLNFAADGSAPQSIITPVPLLAPLPESKPAPLPESKPGDKPTLATARPLLSLLYPEPISGTDLVAMVAPNLEIPVNTNAVRIGYGLRNRSTGDIAEFPGVRGGGPGPLSVYARFRHILAVEPLPAAHSVGSDFIPRIALLPNSTYLGKAGAAAESIGAASPPWPISILNPAHPGKPAVVLAGSNADRWCTLSWSNLGGQHRIVGIASGAVVHWNPDNGEVLARFDVQLGEPVWFGAAAVSAVVAVVASHSGDLRVVTADGGFKPVMPTVDSISALAISPDGSRVFVGSDDGSIRVINTATGEIVRVLRAKGDASAIYDLAVEPDGHLVSLSKLGVHRWLLRLSDDDN